VCLSAIDVRIFRQSFRDVISDLLNEFLNCDSKFFATISHPSRRPWKLTNEFLAQRLPLAGPRPERAQDQGRP
jgi:hypothetical protein